MVKKTSTVKKKDNVNEAAQKMCDLCYQQIKSDDHYVELIDYKFGKFFKRGFYHNKCFHDKINNAITRNVQQLKEKLPVVLNQMKEKYGQQTY